MRSSWRPITCRRWNKREFGPDGKQYAAAQQRVQKQAGQNPKAAALQLLWRSPGCPGRYEPGGKRVVKSHRVAARFPSGVFDAGSTLHRRQSKPEGFGRLQAALAKNPKDVTALMLMGITYNSEKDYKDAATPTKSCWP